MVEVFFEDLIESPVFEKSLFEALDKADKDKDIKIITDLMSYACGMENDFALKMKVVITNYLKQAGRGKSKKIFTSVMERVTPQYKKTVSDFMERYKKENESFFGRLFGGSGSSGKK